MSKQILIIVLSFFLFGSIGHSQNLLNAPEGIVYDTLYNRYLVSNWNSGAIVAIDSFGVQSFFQTGLGNCSGMEIVDTVLYVSCSNQNLVALNLHNSQVIFSMNLSYLGLHGVTNTPDGYLFVTDGGGNRIYKVDPVTQTSTVFSNAGLYRPVGIVYDRFNERLVVVSFGAQHAIQQVDLTTGAVSTIINTTFPNLDDIAIDSSGNFYISVWDDDHNWIYRFDNNFANPPETLVYNDNHGLIDLCYNYTNDILAHTDYWTNKVTYEQIDISISSDSSVGFTPLPIQFYGSSTRDIRSWNWDFGNGATSTEQSPSTEYELPGIYDINLTAVTSSDDTLTRVIKYGAIALADTMKADSNAALEGESVQININLNNTIPVSKITIPVEFSGLLDIKLDSVSLSGCRTEYFPDIHSNHFDGSQSQYTFSISTLSEPLLPAGNGTVAKLFFTINSSSSITDFTEINISGYTSGTTLYQPRITSPLTEFVAQAQNGKIDVICCIGMRGDYNGDGGETLDISDLLFLVDYMFKPPGTSPAPECLTEGDMDLNNTIDITDLLFVVDYMFLPSGTASPPPPCF